MLSKSLDKLIECQISDNNRKGVGYNVVAPPPTGLFAPLTIDLSNSGIEEFKQPKFEGYGVKVNNNVSKNSFDEIKKTSGALIIEDWVSDCDEDETLEKVSESANVQKPKQADQPRKISQNPRNNSTNWNTPMSKKLGVGFQFTPKACFVCGSFNHLIKDCDFHDKKMVQKPVLNNVKKGTGQREVRPVWNNAMRTNHQNFSNSRRNFAPTVVLTKSGLVPISTARQSSSRAATSVSNVRPIKTDAPKSFENLNNKVNTVKVNSVNTAKGKRVTSAAGEQGINVVKSKACWVWRPKIKVLNHVSKNNGSYICKQFDYVDPTGEDIDDSMNVLSVLVVYHTTNGHQFTMSNRQERIGYSKVGDEAVHKELGDRMERVATTASSFEAEQDSDTQTRFEAASKSLMIHLSQEVTHLEVGRTFDQERKEADDIDWSKIFEQAQERQSGSMIRYQALKKKLVTVAQASGSPSRRTLLMVQMSLSTETYALLSSSWSTELSMLVYRVTYPADPWVVTDSIANWSNQDHLKVLVCRITHQKDSIK
ncbi:hypothetical protein Tco_0445897 [Tanacetum coccineum]